ncbi:hypothetical protein BAUCODRAFT_27110 [Baudoinia panamericana UAMH 10762]|uniref:Uncharacterized protein n=1 Tax=Baudoinia panamericana (strain UAMH 10762) TaxID=717646 RepID=M2LFF3_BAUPA|nr:uncharacterized protein BAUCODRAFT_27110 [Baudoinia panamericana UAMH 10762]EMC92767.1 hypothetical protein BAUCODRAFT_27110 [Baudoinia panamericana UAMH 10762]
MLATAQHPSLYVSSKNIEVASVAFTLGAVGTLAAMDKVGNQDGTTQDSGSGGSAYSDLSALENETDEFGRRILQHQRDLQRLNNAIKPGQRAFRHARPRPRRLAERLDTDELANHVQTAQSKDRARSAGSEELEPPLNVPRQWGRRARKRPEWLREKDATADEDGLAANGQAAPDARQADDDAIFPHRTAYTGDEDWDALADEPTASLEDTPPSMRRRRPGLTPTSMGHMNTTLNSDFGIDDHDFSSASLLASTPAVNQRDRKVDELTRKEIESIERRGVAKRTLEQILEQSAVKSTEKRPVTAPSRDTAPQPRRRRSLIANKENMPPNGDVNGTFKGAETVGLVNRTAEAVNVQRPPHKRNDSYNLLKRLARVSSLSPSPAKPKAGGEQAPSADTRMTKSTPELPAKPFTSAQDQLVDLTSRNTQTLTRDEVQELSSAPNGKHEPAAMAAEEGADEMPEGELVTPDIDVTPAHDYSTHDAKTPVVTGAWIDTPKPLPDVRPLLKATDSTIIRAFGTPSGAAALGLDEDPLPENLRREFSEPMHAKSALADVLKEVKAQNDAQFGETTIQSLENIINPSADPTDPTMITDITEAVDAVLHAADSKAPATQAEKDRRQEQLAIEAMNKHLRAARTSIKDADNGLRRVENKIDVAQSADVQVSTPTFKRTMTNGKHGKAICPTCGGKYHTSVWAALWSEFQECFYTWDRSLPYRVRLTRLGIAVVLFLLWYTIESVLCHYYCWHMYAESMIGFGVDPDAPMFPFVIPTLLLRPFEPMWRPVWEALAWCFGVAFHYAFGDSTYMDTHPWNDLDLYDLDGDMEIAGNTLQYGRGWAQTATASLVSESTRVLRSAVTAVDEVGSMWDDAVLG